MSIPASPQDPRSAAVDGEGPGVPLLNNGFAFARCGWVEQVITAAAAGTGKRRGAH
jgi:hypothetical protein